MSSTRHLQTQTGRQIALGKELGKGGEGIVYQVQGEPALAAKIYHPNKASERRQKIEAIVDAHWHKAASNIAFPIDTLMGPGTQFVGFTMPLVAANKPIHNLYSPTSRKTSFPKANFPFLTRTALNIAQSFVDVHKTGCIIGDVNHSGVLIADDAIATLIDCDSFQVNVAGQTFLCKVGTPDFTPPELQGKRFDQCVRTANHDAFGLAVVLFNLLFMGRHPFAGRYLGRGDMPLETAIAQYRFAYSARHNETRTEPPPNVPLLADIPRELSDAFEIAFGPVGTSKGRPIAAQWVSILQRAESEIVQCKNSSGHQHFRAAIYCPWCRMETAYPGFLAFAPPIISVTTNPTNLANLIAAVRGISDPGNAPELSSLMPAFNGKASQATQSGKWKWLRSYAAAAACLLASLVMFRLKEPGPLLGLLGLAGGAFLAFRPSNADQPIRQLISQSASAWQNIERQWNQVCDNRGFSQERRNAEELVRQIQGLGSDEAARIANLKAQQREAELNRFLQNFYIDRAKIKGIGASRKVMLRSYGLETAADISQSRIQQISGFGPVIAGGLVAWRTSFERRFVHNPNQPLNPIDVAAVKAAIAKRLSDLEVSLRQSLNRLQGTANHILGVRNSLRASGTQTWNAKKQAEANLLAFNSGLTPQQRLFGLGAIFVAGFLLVSALEPSIVKLFGVNSSSFIPTQKSPASQPTLPSKLTLPSNKNSGFTKTDPVGSIAPGTAPPAPTPLPRAAIDPSRAGSSVKEPSAEAIAQAEPFARLAPPLIDELLKQKPRATVDPSTPRTSVNEPPIKPVGPVVHSADPPPPTSIEPVAPTAQAGQPDPVTSPVHSATMPTLDVRKNDDAKRVQQRLIDFGFLFGFADGIWGPRSRKALQDFRFAHGLSDTDIWDEQAQSLLLSESPVHGESVHDVSFVGGWGTDSAQCRLEGSDRRFPVTISERSAESFGGVCEFNSIQRETLRSWRIQAVCRHNGERWNANIQFTLRGARLTWSSERGTVTYVRCLAAFP